MIPINHFIDRRQFLSHTASGFGSVALASLLARDGLLGAQEKVRESAAGKNPITPVIDPGNPNAPRLPHFEPRAKQVLMIFCSGAVSQIDTFDYKPELIKHHGKPMPGGENLITFQGQQGNLTRSPWEFKPRGQSGKMISDLVPKLGDLADEMCFLHAMTGKTNTHGPGENFMCTGFTLDGFPSAGSWMTYALGSAADGAEIRLLDAAYWIKGCSSLGRLRYAALVEVLGGDRPQLALLDVKEAVPHLAPAAAGIAVPPDHAERVVAGARALSPNLGDRMVAGHVGDRAGGTPVTVRELLPQDLKIDAEQFSRGEAVRVSRHLAAILGRAHGRQMGAADRRTWIDAVRAPGPGPDAPGWLWSVVTDLMGAHQRGYLEHCRRIAREARDAA